MNTSVTATFKDGSKKSYETIELAAKDTGVSVASIKIRANRPGASGKDGITFDWNDPHTKRSQQAKKSKSKGSAAEYDVVKRLKEIGFVDAKTTRGESKSMDNAKIDIMASGLPTNIQVKHTQNLPNYFAIRDSCPDKSKPFTMIWKKAAQCNSISPGTVAIIDVNFFYELLSSYYTKSSVTKRKSANK